MRIKKKINIIITICKKAFFHINYQKLFNIKEIIYL